MEFDDSLSTSMGDFGESTQDLEIPESLPMMAVRDVVVFNYMIIPLFVGRPGSIEAVNEGLSKNKLLMLVTQKDPTTDDPEEKDLYRVGMVSMIMRTLKLPDGRLKVLVHDGFGVWLVARRLNQGKFVWGDERLGPRLTLSAEQLQALVTGLPWQRLGDGAVITVL